MHQGLIPLRFHQVDFLTIWVLLLPAVLYYIDILWGRLAFVTAVSQQLPRILNGSEGWVLLSIIVGYLLTIILILSTQEITLVSNLRCSDVLVATAPGQDFVVKWGIKMTYPPRQDSPSQNERCSWTLLGSTWDLNQRRLCIHGYFDSLVGINKLGLSTGQGIAFKDLGNHESGAQKYATIDKGLNSGVKYQRGGYHPPRGRYQQARNWKQRKNWMITSMKREEMTTRSPGTRTWDIRAGCMAWNHG